MHVSLVPVLGSGEQKSKPTQHSVRALMASGIQPDLVLCRCRDPIDEALRRKLAMFCQVDDGNMLTVADVSNIYHVPLLLHNQGAASRIGSLVRAAEAATQPAAHGAAVWFGAHVFGCVDSWGWTSTQRLAWKRGSTWPLLWTRRWTRSTSRWLASTPACRTRTSPY